MKIQHDRQLSVALGNSRKTKAWKNRMVSWSSLLDRLAKETRTPETMAEYKAMSRDQQADVKDVGGYVGGYCNNGSRSDIRFRSVLCLDADFAERDLWPDWELLYGHAAAVYSTHKHTPEKPRLRLVVPLLRNVTPDEYQAIGRRVAETLGIDMFDDTSYEPGRMMYWPSTSQDGQFYFKHLDAPLLDPDKILATYHDWRDVSSWPMSSRVAELVKKANRQQKDPLTKGGAVGAFCRAYSIQEAIEAYVPTYTPCDEPGRYTYTEGSTAAGVIVYDDKYSYSHHATDPASMQLCNAWDLVRLHKFGALDEDVAPDTPATSRPSYRAMQQLATSDEKVKAQLVADRMAEAKDDFAEAAPEPAAEAEGNWRTKLKLTEKGAIAQTIGNVVLVLRHDPRLAGCVAVNEFSHDLVAAKELPWRKVTGPTSIWTDRDDAALRLYLEQVYGLTGKDRIYDAVNTVALRNKFHPVRDYLDACTWDGVARVETLLVDYLGAEDNAYTRAVTRKTLAAAVARIYEPGCKFDQMLTIQGDQGKGKSTLLARLGGEWFSDSFAVVTGKEAYEQAQGVWIVEVGELEGMRRAEASAIKLYLSKTVDRFRPAYGRRIQEFPRQCIFVGTTNEMQFLRDTTGNRRFWVVNTPSAPRRSVWDDLTPETVQQIWAEAVAIYKRGEPLHLSEALERMAREVQETYEEENPRAGIVADYLDRLLPEDWDNRDLYDRRAWLESDAEGTVERTTVCTMELWAEALGQSPDRFDRYAGKEVRDIMHKLKEWRHMGSAKKTIKPYGRQRYYERMGREWT